MANPRQSKISSRLMARLLMLPKTNQYIFGNGKLNAFRWRYDRQKHALSIKVANPTPKTSKISQSSTFQSYKGIRNNKKHPSRKRTTRTPQHKQHISLYPPGAHR